LAAALLSATVFGVACEKKPDAGEAVANSSTAQVAMGAGAASIRPASSGSVTLSVAQINHGKIRWEPATRGSQAASATVPGTITPNEDRTARLSAPAEGRVTAVYVQPGQPVRRGQLLVALQSPEAGMAQADLAKANSAVSSMRAQATYARAARGRAERLLALKAISRQEYERAVADDELARAGLGQASAEARRAGSTAQQLGAVASAMGVISLRSPLSGVALSRSAQPGAVVAAGTELISVTDPSSLWVKVDAPEKLAGLFAVGSVVKLAVPAYPGESFDARVSSVGAGLDADTRTLPVRASVATTRGKLKPAMLASVTVQAPGTATATLIPDEAIQPMAGKPTVFIARPNSNGTITFVAREVEVGARTAGTVSVIRGLAPGELVVVRGAFAIKAEMQKSSMPGMEM